MLKFNQNSQRESLFPGSEFQERPKHDSVIIQHSLSPYSQDMEVFLKKGRASLSLVSLPLWLSMYPASCCKGLPFPLSRASFVRRFRALLFPWCRLPLPLLLPPLKPVSVEFCTHKLNPYAVHSSGPAEFHEFFSNHSVEFESFIDPLCATVSVTSRKLKSSMRLSVYHISFVTC